MQADLLKQLWRSTVCIGGGSEIKQTDKIGLAHLGTSTNSYYVGLLQAELFWPNFWHDKTLTVGVRVLIIGTLTNGNPYTKSKGLSYWDMRYLRMMCHLNGQE